MLALWGTLSHSPVAHPLPMSSPNPTSTPTDAASPQSQTPSSGAPPPVAPVLPSQTLSSRAPPTGIQGPAPFHPPPGLPYLYGHPGPNVGQYRAAGVGMSIPQFYYRVPPYPLLSQPLLGQPPLSQHGSTGAWGYGPPAGRAVPNTLPHTGSLHTSNAPPVRTTEWQVRTEGVRQLAINRTTPRQRRVYPNRQVRDGGMSHSV